MTKILEMLEALEPTREGHNNPSDICYAAYKELPDIKRIVEWVESADHKSGCDMWEHPHTGFCDCDLSEIQSLIRSDK